MKLSIIIVNYHSKKFLLLCLASINRFLYQNAFFKNKFEVILVNNENKPLSLSIKYPFLNKKIIETGQNCGFGVAANIGSIIAKGKYLLFLNPDSIFVDTSLEKAIEYLNKNQKIGAIGLSIIDQKRKTPQNWSCGKKTTWASILFRNTINKPWNKKHPQKVDWSSGAGLIVRKKIFRKIKGFDKDFFMYFEDQDLCLRIKKLNLKIIHYPEAKILHFNGKSWQDNKQKKREYYTSQLKFFQKHNSRIGYLILKTIYSILKKYIPTKK